MSRPSSFIPLFVFLCLPPYFFSNLLEYICKWMPYELVQWYGNKINDRIFHDDGLRAFCAIFNGDKTFMVVWVHNSSMELKLTLTYSWVEVDLYFFSFVCVSTFFKVKIRCSKKKHLLPTVSREYLVICYVCENG